MRYNNPTEAVQEKDRYWTGVPNRFWPLALRNGVYYCCPRSRRWYRLYGYPIYLDFNPTPCTELYVRLKYGVLP